MGRGRWIRGEGRCDSVKVVTDLSLDLQCPFIYTVNALGDEHA